MGEVIGYLGKDAAKIYRVYGGEAVGFVNFRVGEEGFDEVWQSSNVPSTTRLCTFASMTVVICASCTGLALPWGA